MNFSRKAIEKIAKKKNEREREKENKLSFFDYLDLWIINIIIFLRAMQGFNNIIIESSDYEIIIKKTDCVINYYKNKGFDVYIIKLAYANDQLEISWI